MLGTADRQGLGALKADHRVADMISPPPVLSLVRPVAAAPAKMKTKTVQCPWDIRLRRAPSSCRDASGP
jgi:hypothetical protein